MDGVSKLENNKLQWLNNFVILPAKIVILSKLKNTEIEKC